MTQPPYLPPNQPPTRQQPPAKSRPKWPVVLIAAVLAIFVIGMIAGIAGSSDDTAGNEPEPAPVETTTQAEPEPEPTEGPEPDPEPTEPQPEPEPAGPTPEIIESYIAGSTGTGATTYAEACTAGGLGWVCNVEHATPRGSTLEVRVRTIEASHSGDDIARSFYNFLALPDDSPMPDVSFVQVTTAADGEVGRHRG